MNLVFFVIIFFFFFVRLITNFCSDHIVPFKLRLCFFWRETEKNVIRFKEFAFGSVISKVWRFGFFFNSSFVFLVLSCHHSSNTLISRLKQDQNRMMDCFNVAHVQRYSRSEEKCKWVILLSVESFFSINICVDPKQRSLNNCQAFH